MAFGSIRTARTARAEGGCTWGDFNHATYAFGLATTGGIISTTGIARPDAWRRHWLPVAARSACRSTTCSRPTSSRPTAAFVVASENENEDLFWALRGGGGNFGVVTSFEYQLHPVKDIVAGIFFYPLDRAARGP